MVEEIRKTVRFSKEEFDYIMSDDDLREPNRWSGYNDDTSFSVRIREMIKRYEFQKNRIEGLVKENKTLSDKCARLSDKSDIKMSDDRYQTSDKGYPKEVGGSK